MTYKQNIKAILDSHLTETKEEIKDSIINCILRLSLKNSDWLDLLSDQFNVSRTTAKNMLHVMMSVKRLDNIRKRGENGSV